MILGGWFARPSRRLARAAREVGAAKLEKRFNKLLSFERANVISTYGLGATTAWGVLAALDDIEDGQRSAQRKLKELERDADTYVLTRHQAAVRREHGVRPLVEEWSRKLGNPPVRQDGVGDDYGREERDHEGGETHVVLISFGWLCGCVDWRGLSLR